MSVGPRHAVAKVRHRLAVPPPLLLFETLHGASTASPPPISPALFSAATSASHNTKSSGGRLAGPARPPSEDENVIFLSKKVAQLKGTTRSKLQLFCSNPM